jgi:hypothetical protein
VLAGLKLPHCALPQLTDQVTPAFALSLATVAVKEAFLVAASEAGGLVRVTAIDATGVVMLMLAETDLVESVTDVAVTVTVVAAAGAL